MSANRILGRVDGLATGVKGGDTLVSSHTVTVVAADAAYTLTVSDVAAGVIQFTGLSAGRNLTTPTAAALTATFPEVDIGESLVLTVSITTAFALTLVAGTTVTLAGLATVPASACRHIYFTRTAASAWTARVL